MYIHLFCNMSPKDMFIAVCASCAKVGFTLGCGLFIAEEARVVESEEPSQNVRKSLGGRVFDSIQQRKVYSAIKGNVDVDKNAFFETKLHFSASRNPFSSSVQDILLTPEMEALGPEIYTNPQYHHLPATYYYRNAYSEYSTRLAREIADSHLSEISSSASDEEMEIIYPNNPEYRTNRYNITSRHVVDVNVRPGLPGMRR